MKYAKFIGLICVVFFCYCSGYAQDDRKSSTDTRTTKSGTPETKTITVSQDDFNKKKVEDVRIISSNSSYIEIEFTPQYIGESFDFANASAEQRKQGDPDLRMKSFPIFFPVANNNRIEIVDYKYEDIQNVDIKPAPTPKKSNDKLDVIFDYVRNDKVYNTNAFFPSSSGMLLEAGTLRNKYFGYANISPVLYNPVTRTVRKYSYIRFRITFGGSPITSNKVLSREELGFFTGLAVNSDVGMNWSTREFNASDNLVTNSVLASGNFYKIEIKETGMYRLDKNFLQTAGINLTGVDPKNIKIYGNGGRELPYNNVTPAPDDLIENKILVSGEDDGVFNDEDYIVFFGRSPNDWKYNPSSRTYTHYINHFDTKNYYFITVDGAPSVNRMQVIASPNIGGAPQVQSFTDMVFEEPEVNNLGSTGVLWLSQKIGPNESFTYNKELKGYINNTNVNLRTRFGNASLSSQATFEVKDENSSYSTLVPVYQVLSNDGFSHINLINPAHTASYSLGGNNSIKLKISLPSAYNNSSISGYMDYYEVLYNRSLSSAENNSLYIHGPDTNGTMEYNVSTFNSSDVRVFDITNEFSASIITPISYSNGTVKFQSNHVPGTPNNFYIVGGNNYKTPVSISPRIPNQNIHGISDGASFIILSPTEFMDQANRLKTYRENSGYNSLKTIVLDINQVYNEFSGGMQDPVAVRNLLKYAFNNWQERPVYVMYMGDGTYDYKNIYNLQTKNWLPPIEKTTDDINEINSFPSDDFAMDINESWETPFAVVPDFASGRACVNSLDEAQTVIDKIISYESPASNGIWKKKIMYVADDGWTTSQTQGQEGTLHTGQSEEIAENRTPKDFEKEKIYIVAYPTVITPQGRRKPGANVDIIKGWNEGRLVINYVGHGSTDLWAHEQIFERQTSIPQLNNKDRYPIVTIASCDLARFDDPFFVSAAEQLVNLKEKGAIAVIAAVRPVYSAPNADFNQELWDNFMKKKDTLNLPIRLGKAIFNTKNVQVANDNNAKFMLLADPTIRTEIPQFFTRVDSINGAPGTSKAVIKALQKVHISGSVLNPDSSFWGDFNGQIDVKIFDVDKMVTVFDFGTPFTYRLDGGKIFNGRANVVNGLWNIEFIVPKDISYNTGNGKLIAYFSNANADGSGFTNNFVLNGLDSTAYADTTGPTISVYLGDRNFRSGDVVNQNTKIIGDFFDESGMNLTGTIGHKVEAIINNDENGKIDLTPFYNSTSNYQNGTLEYPLQNLPDGSYTIKLAAWDTYNNVNYSSVDFKVVNNSQLAVQRVYNYPNPMVDNTSFVFQHNFDIPLNVKVKVYTVSGRLIKELNKSNITDKFVQMDWDGRDDDGDAIANGTYIYKVLINSEDGSFSTNSTGKLAKLK